MDVLEFMKKCLIDYDYPNIHGLPEDGKIYIFSTANRKFLVLWLFKQIDPEYGPMLENYSKESLADVVCQHGFCTAKQKLAFMNGELTPLDELDILHRMFKFMADISTLKPRSDDSKISNEYITNVKDLDINLFPSFGTKQTLSSEQLKNKILEYQHQLDQMKELISNNNDQLLEISNPNEYISRIKTTVSDFESTVKEFKSTIQELPFDIDTKPEKTLSLAAEDLGQCKENITLVKKFIKDAVELKTSEKFSSDYWKEHHNESLRTALEQILGIFHSINIIN